MSKNSEPHEVDYYNLLDQTLYLASRIYDDPKTPPTPLDMHSACAIGSYQSVKDAIEGGTDYNKRNKPGWTPLMYACYVGHDTVVNLLLDSGAEPSRGTPSGLTPLMVAAGCGNESVCYFLLQAGAEIDSQDTNGYSAVVHAVRQGHQTAVQLLLEAGADIELKDYEHGYTALMQACIEGDEIIVDVLVACDADLSAVDNNGETARSLAYKHHHVRTATLLDNAIFMFKQTPDNSGTLPSIPDANNDDGGKDGEGDLFSGAKDAETYQQSLIVKKSIQEMLGRRAGPRWSLPHDYIAARRASAPAAQEMTSQQRRRLLRAAMSMPDRDEDLSEEEPVVDRQLAEFLTELNLEKYIEVFEHQEIDFQSFLSLTDEELKRIGITLMGPRRKISVAVVEYRQRQAEEEDAAPLKTHTPDKMAESGRSRHGEDEGDTIGADLPAFKKKGRPMLVKQSSTDVTAAYRTALEKVEYLEEQLAKENQLRKTTDGYILNLQTSRQEAVSHVNRVRGGQKDTAKHFKAVQVTYKKLFDEVECLRLLSTSSVVDPDQLHKLYSEIVTQCSKMGMEFEALSRSVEASKEVTESLAYHLGGL